MYGEFKTQKTGLGIPLSESNRPDEIVTGEADSTYYMRWSTPVCDLMTIDERVNHPFNAQKLSYDDEFVNRAKQKVIEAWNKRSLDSELLEALQKIATWSDGGNSYGQTNIKKFAKDIIGKAMRTSNESA